MLSGAFQINFFHIRRTIYLCVYHQPLVIEDKFYSKRDLIGIDVDNELSSFSYVFLIRHALFTEPQQ